MPKVGVWVVLSRDAQDNWLGSSTFINNEYVWGLGFRISYRTLSLLCLSHRSLVRKPSTMSPRGAQYMFLIKEVHLPSA